MVRKAASGSDIESKVKPGRKLSGIIAKGFKHRLRLWMNDGLQDRRAIRAEVEVRIMEPGEWKRILARDEAKGLEGGTARMQWSAVELDGGMILAVRSVAGGRSSERETLPRPKRAAKMRRLRDLIFETLESHRDEFVGVSCEIGAEGQATFHVDLDAETHEFTADIDLSVNECDL